MAEAAAKGTRCTWPKSLNKKEKQPMVRVVQSGQTFVSNDKCRTRRTDEHHVKLIVLCPVMAYSRDDARDDRHLSLQSHAASRDTGLLISMGFPVFTR